MWTFQSRSVANGRGIHVTLARDAEPVSYSDVLNLWQQDSTFRTAFIQQLAHSEFAAFRWETPPVTIGTVHRPFEYVLMNSPDLAVAPDINTFAAHFQATHSSAVVEFPNLGHDAMLIVPCPGEPLSAYSHLGAFVREAPEAQKQSLWQRVGAAMQRRLSTRPVWLSTAGGGVAWLHVRLDDRPKYYGYQPYRVLP